MSRQRDRILRNIHANTTSCPPSDCLVSIAWSLAVRDGRDLCLPALRLDSTILRHCVGTAA
ncbi:hypothetical protein NMD1_04037 [Novosphingobium sp. MD-1]|nr:hypothetical protein NMD1_04037 [Novosphingobium sp. MD-1]